MCTNCPSTCFSETTSNCIEYTGSSFTDLNVNQGNSLTSTLESALSELESIRKKVEESYCGDSSDTTSNGGSAIGNVSGLQSGSVTQMTKAAITVDTSISGSFLQVSYNASEVIQECGGTLTRFNASVSGRYNDSISNIQLGSSESQVGVFNLKLANCPITLDIEAVVLAKGVEKRISFSKQLACQVANYSEYAVLKDFGQSANINSQAGVNESLINQVNSLQTNIQALLNSTVDGKSISETLSDQQVLIQSQSDLITTLQGTIQTLEDRVDALERTV